MILDGLCISLNEVGIVAGRGGFLAWNHFFMGLEVEQRDYQAEEVGGKQETYHVVDKAF
jgi:hypothetical protein